MRNNAATASAAPSLFGSVLQAANPVRILAGLWHERHLTRQLTWREITGRYRSSMLGLLWSFITPLVTLSLYTYVFGVVFKARWPGARTGSLGEFGLMLFAGLTAFTLLSECINRAPHLITAQPNYVKKVVFPLEILPVSVLGAALFHAGISLLLLALAEQVVLGRVVWTILLAPLVLLPLVLLALGTSWAIASLGVFFRDIGHTVALIMQVLFFTTPIFYALEAVPAPWRDWLLWNPLVAVVDNMRRVSVSGTTPNWHSLATSAICGLVVFSLGHAWFVKTKRGFADVL